MFTTEHLSKEMQKNWVRVREITTTQNTQISKSNNYLQNETDELLKQFYRGEYETWQLVNELVSVEKLYFDKKSEWRDGQVKQLCPKTLEFETLMADHASSVIHAVAHWLEKIYEPNEKFKMEPLKLD